MSVDLVAINGEVFTPENAKISVFDRGFLFGDAVYEVTRSYGHILFQLELHIDRLIRSAHAIDLNLGLSRDEIINELYRIYKKAKKPDRYLRWQVSRGEGAIGMATHLAKKANWVIYVKDLDTVAPTLYQVGVPIVTTRRLRNAKEALDPNIKSGNYLNNVLAYREATQVRAFEAVMVDAEGFCTEGTTSNIFRIKKGVIHTPPYTSDILVGITRTLIFEIAKKFKMPIEEKHFTPEELENSDEAFISGSVREILPVSSINGKAISVGPVVQKLQEHYRNLISEYCEFAQSQHPWK